jgi:hypothetical protein
MYLLQHPLTKSTFLLDDPVFSIASIFHERTSLALGKLTDSSLIHILLNSVLKIVCGTRFCVVELFRVADQIHHVSEKD